ncbi:MAG: single-stranded-DNA-specific exonuclease RecJ [Chloroflexota bacterium]|nr:single-stranded-DNA-specific exonuclease RecJ [Chloroflexota bacterium]
MSLVREWSVRKRAPAAVLDRLGVDSPLLAQLLVNRGVASAADARAFLAPTCDEPPDGSALAGLGPALARIETAVRRRERIVVYGDYDADGLSGATLLGRALRAAGAEATVFIPHRERDGYGLNATVLEQLAHKAVGLVITVDCGVSGVMEVAAARAVGLDVIVTDHHEPPAVLPDALAIVNPRRADCPYPFKQLAGAGVALAVARAIVRRLVPERRWDELDDRLHELATLGTVADIMPLIGPNRAIVHRGLRVMNQRPSAGLLALFERVGARPGEVDASTVAFKVAPRLNAPGRIADASVAHHLLAAPDPGVAGRLAAEIEALNDRRKDLLADDLARARDEVLALGASLPPAVILCGDYNLGLLGLLAARLAEETGRPVAVLNRAADVCRGSVRGIPGFDTIAAVRACHALLERYGGHRGAAGLSVAADRLSEFERVFLAAAEEGLSRVAAPEPPLADCRLRPETVTWDLTMLLGRLEPCGESNAAPRFETRNLYVLESRVVSGGHVRLTLGAPGTRLAGIAFNAADDGPRAGQAIDVLHRVRRNVWKDRRSVELEVIGWRPARA